MTALRHRRRSAGSGTMTTFADLLLNLLIIILLILFVYMVQLPEVQAAMQQAVVERKQAENIANAAAQAQAAADQQAKQLEEHAEDIAAWSHEIRKAEAQQLEDRKARMAALDSRDQAIERAREAIQRADRADIEAQEKIAKAEAIAQTAVSESRQRADRAERIAQEKIVEAETLAQAAAATAENARRQSKVDRAALARAVTTIGLDVVFIIDVSKSWEVQQTQVLETINLLSDVMPDLAAEVRFGVIGFREAVAYEYPLSQVFPTEIDNGQSKARLSRFIETMAADGARVDIELAIDRGLGFMGNRVTDGRIQLLIVVGDVGMEEKSGDDVLDHFEIEAAKTLFARVGRWASNNPENRRVLTLYMGEKSNPVTDGETFFRFVAEKCGKQGHYSDNPSRLVIDAVRAAIPQ